MEQSQTTTPSPTDRMKVREKFNRIMREVDFLIKQSQFNDATIKLLEAKEMDPANPYVKAFEERLGEASKSPKAAKHTVPHQPAPQSVMKTPEQASPAESLPPAQPQPKLKQPVTERDLLESKLREDIESEYRERYTNQLRTAEKKALHLVEQEQEKLKKQRELLKEHFDQNLVQMQQQLENEYRTKLDDEVRQAEERLRKQFESEQTFFETEMKNSLSVNYEKKLADLETRLNEQQNELAKNEKQSIVENERRLKEQYNHRLLEELRKAETVIYQQSAQQQKLEQEKLTAQLTKEFEEKLAKERENLKQGFERQQGSLRESFQGERKKMEQEFRQHLEEQLEQARKRESEELEKKRLSLVQQLEQQHKKKYAEEVEAERGRIRAESDAIIESERERLRLEQKKLVEEEVVTLRKTRLELRVEMDKNLIDRLEQLQYEYERRIDLLGIKVPESFEDRLALYHDRLSESYADGMPSVDQAKKIFELKELLELSYEDHIKVDGEVRLEQYVRSLEKGMINGTLDLTNKEKLEELKERFQILPEEAAQIEPHILSKMIQHIHKGTVLVADDEMEIRNGLAEILEDEGFTVISCGSVDEALKNLKSSRVHLILSDIKFLQGEPDGFIFFQSVQKIPELRSIPFIFLSSLTDNVIVRSGMQLGIDDYITKPVDPDFLVAVVRGKLKRQQKT
jgi:CheY-like chemotaxis protein